MFGGTKSTISVSEQTHLQTDTLKYVTYRLQNSHHHMIHIKQFTTSARY